MPRYLYNHYEKDVKVYTGKIQISHRYYRFLDYTYIPVTNTYFAFMYFFLEITNLSSVTVCSNIII